MIPASLSALIFLLTATSVAHAASCAQKYAAFNQTIKNGFLDAHDRDEIEKVLQDPKLDSREKAKGVFHLSVEARLRLLDPDDAKAIRAVMEKVEKDYQTGFIGGSHDPRTNHVKLLVPEGLKSTAAEYALLLHDLEHAIQHQVVHQGKPRGTDLLSQWQFMRHFAEERFHMEQGAMIAEWQYLNALPEDLRIGLARMIKKSSDFHPLTKDTIVHILGASSADSAEAYLALQYGRGRYSMAVLEKDQPAMEAGARKYFLKRVAPYLGYTSVVVPLVWSCSQVIGSKGSSPEDRSLCSQVIDGMNRGLNRASSQK